MNSSKKIVLVSLFFSLLSLNALAQKELIIVTGDYPPYLSKNNKKESYLTQVLHKVADEMGVKFKFKFMPWKRCEITVDQLQAWAAIPYLRTPEREKKFAFSELLYTSNTKFFYYMPKDKKKAITYSGLYSGLKDLKPYKIGGIIGYYYVQAFLDAGLKPQLVTNEDQNLNKLFVGRIDLIPINETIGWHLINTRFPPEQVKNFGTLDNPLKTAFAYLMTSKKYPNTQELLKRFNQALEKIKSSGVYKKIIDQYGVTVIF